MSSIREVCKMRTFLVGLLCAALLFAQNPNTAIFPGGVADDEDLLVQSNSATTTLDGTIDASTLSINLVDATAFRTPGVITIDSERIKICSKSVNALTVCSGGRGFGSSSATSHTSGASVFGYLTEHEHNQLAAEIKAIETALAGGTTTDFVPSVSGSILYIGAGKARIGNYTPVSIVTSSVTFTDGTGAVKVFIDSSNNLACHMATGIVASESGAIACSNVTTPAYPANSIPIATVQVTATVASVTSDDRAFFTNRGISAGTGVSISDSGGVASIGIDTATIPQLGAGSNDFTGIGSFLEIKLLNSSEGTCDVDNRSRIVVVHGAAGVSDTIKICIKDASNNYVWQSLF